MKTVAGAVICCVYVFSQLFPVAVVPAQPIRKLCEDNSERVEPFGCVGKEKEKKKQQYSDYTEDVSASGVYSISYTNPFLSRTCLVMDKLSSLARYLGW